VCWALMTQRIAASMYTLPAIPEIDCGYRPNGVIKMFHAVSLDWRPGGGQGPCLHRAPAGAMGSFAWRGQAELTAVVEPLRALSVEDEVKHEFGRRERGALPLRGGDHGEPQIAFLTMNDLARAAQTARIDLRL